MATDGDHKRRKLPFWLGIAAALVYVAGFGFFIWAGHTIFDAEFFIALLGWPLSLVAAITSSSLQLLLVHESGIYPVDLVVLFLFGVLQYFIVGYLVGRAIAFLIARWSSVEHAA